MKRYVISFLKRTSSNAPLATTAKPPTVAGDREVTLETAMRMLEQSRAGGELASTLFEGAARRHASLNKCNFSKSVW